MPDTDIVSKALNFYPCQCGYEKNMDLMISGHDFLNCYGVDTSRSCKKDKKGLHILHMNSILLHFYSYLVINSNSW